jgi:GT2 family glycosyltransferase
MPSPIKVIALISTYNEADIIASAVRALIQEGLSVYLLDDGSTDATVEAVQPFLDHGLLEIERMDQPASAKRYSLRRVLERKESLAGELDADWFLHTDADEFRESPWEGINLVEGIQRVDELGYNAIDFEVLEFVPTHSGFHPGDDPRAAFPYYRPGGPWDRTQIKCWKKTSAGLDLVSSGGHDAGFAGKRVFPVRFLLRHYPFRGQEHGERKLLLERRPLYADEERATGWHLQYNAIQPGHAFVQPPSGLSRFDAARVRIDLQINHRLVEDLTREVRELAAQGAELRSERDGFRVERDLLAKGEDRLRQDRAEAQYEREALRAERSAVDDERRALRAERSAHDDERRTLRAEREALRRDRETLARSLDDLRRERNGLEVDLERARTDRDSFARANHDLLGEVQGLQRGMRELHDSYSWRVTAPLRWLGAPLFAWRSAPAARPVPSPGARPADPGHGRSALSPENQQAASSVEVPIAGLRELDELQFSLCPDPVVSIIIPAFNHWKTTYACLAALRRNTSDRLPHELLVADDGSTDETAQMLQKVRGITVVQNSINLGFLETCNRAAKQARGRYLVFLNNDTEVQPDWLEALVQTAERHPRAGLVGGKLLFPDGRVQEAGSVLGQDGWGHPYGWLGDADACEFNYVKDVDCFVGACMLVRTDLFRALGGFDSRYAPAFYEEFDLQFAARAAGYRVIYQPRARIVHLRSCSYGQETRDRQAAVNHARFCEKWAALLPEQSAAGDDLFRARDRSLNKRVLLVIDDSVPAHDKHAGGMTVHQYLRLFGEMGFKVIYLPDDLMASQPYTTELQDAGVEVIYGAIDVSEWLKAHGRHVDFVWMARPDVAVKYLSLIRKHTRARVVYYTHDLHALRERRRYETEGTEEALRESIRYERLESRIFGAVDCILTPSEQEAAVISGSVRGKKVLRIPSQHYDAADVSRGGRGFEDRQGLLFIGGFSHLPNVDAVRWFAREILPLIAEAIDGVRFYVVGSNPPDEIRALEGEHLVVTGFASDLNPWIDRCLVSVAPLRYGAGVKGKIVTSLVRGLPVVTTPVGNEGVQLTDGENGLLAADAVSFARQTIALCQDRELWERLSAGGLELVRRRFSKALAVSAIQEAFGVTGVSS